MKRKRTLFTLWFVLAITVISGCQQAEEASSENTTGGTAPVKLTPVKYAQLGVSLTDVHFEFAAEKGIYKNNGIDIEFIHFDKGGPEALAAAASNQIDIGNFGTPILTGISKGIPIKVVGSPPITENPFVLVAANDIQSVQDLKGKTIATGALGGGSHQAALKILRANGLSESDVTISATGGAEMQMVLSSGKVAAVITTEPTVTKIETDKQGHTLVKGADAFGVYQHSFVFATNKLIQSNPDAVRAVLKANTEANRYAATHQDELVDYAVEKTKLPVTIVRDFYAKTIPTWTVDGKVNVEGAKNAFAILKELKEADASFDPNQTEAWFDSSFLPE